VIDTILTPRRRKLSSLCTYRRLGAQEGALVHADCRVLRAQLGEACDSLSLEVDCYLKAAGMPGMGLEVRLVGCDD
jgi:hypothetical protein